MRQCLEWDELVTLEQATNWDFDGVAHHLEACQDCRLRMTTVLRIRSDLVLEGLPDTRVGNRVADALFEGMHLSPGPSPLLSAVVASLTATAAAVVLLVWLSAVAGLWLSWPITTFASGVAGVTGGASTWRRIAPGKPGRRIARGGSTSGF